MSENEDIKDIPADGSAPEYTAPDPKSKSKVIVSVPKWCEHSDSTESFETTNGTTVNLETIAIQMDDSGFQLKIAIDDSGYLDWWSGGSLSDYIETSKEEYFNSSWPISVDGREGIVLVQGSANSGGELSGDAFVTIDGTTVWFSATPSDDKAPAANAYSEFFRSQKMCDLLDGISLSTQ